MESETTVLVTDLKVGDKIGVKTGPSSIRYRRIDEITHHPETVVLRISPAGTQPAPRLAVPIHAKVKARIKGAVEPEVAIVE